MTATPIIAREGFGDKGGETRAMRGLELFRERGGEIVTYPVSGEYGVPSATEEGVLYTVSLEGEGECGCPCFRFRGGPCKHVYAATIFRAKAAAKTARRVAGRARRRCSGAARSAA